MGDSKEAKYYIYEHWRPDTNLPFYVGKGHGRRSGKMTERNDYHKKIQEKLRRNSLSVKVVFVQTDMPEVDAFALERERIAYWRAMGVPLCNFTDGGEGASGARHTEEWKAAARARYKGVPRPDHIIEIFKRPKSEEHKKKLSEANRGKKLSEGTKEKIGDAFRGRRLTDEHKKKIGAAHKGRPKTPEHIAKLSTSLRGRKMPPEAIEKMRAASTGRKHSEETIQKLLASFTDERRASVSAKLKGRPKSDDHRKKIGEAHKGRVRSEQHKQRISASWTPERRARQSELAKAQFSKNRMGKNG